MKIDIDDFRRAEGEVNRDSAERAYNLIMKEKEKLLSFDTKLKFIVSHSALKEGRDHPNGFQIGTLRDFGTERERRQTIGRGPRLALKLKGDEMGHRVRGFEVNTLTVIAMESYEDFAETLQKKIEKDTGILVGIVEKHQFASILITKDDGSTARLGFGDSAAIYDHLQAKGYVDTKGRVQDTLKTALKAGKVELPEAFQTHQAAIREILRKLGGKLDIKNAADRVKVNTRAAVLAGEEFRALWDRIVNKRISLTPFGAEY